MDSQYAVALHLTEAERKLLQQVKKLKGQDDVAVLQSSLRLVAAMLPTGEANIMWEMRRKEMPARL